MGCKNIIGLEENSIGLKKFGNEKIIKI